MSAQSHASDRRDVIEGVDGKICDVRQTSENARHDVGIGHKPCRIGILQIEIGEFEGHHQKRDVGRDGGDEIEE